MKFGFEFYDSKVLQYLAKIIMLVFQKLLTIQRQYSVSKMKNMFTNQAFQELKILGEGTYGKCFLVSNITQNQLYVLKKIEVGGMNDQKIEETMKQARILQALDHPNIIKFIDSYIENGVLNIVMDYADEGDLSAKIKNAKGYYFSENQILNWFTQICLAIKHVHDRKIIHRDLKSQNIFLTSENIVKLGDFGIAKPLQRTLQKNKTVVGTPYYMSPQICDNKEYSLKTDIWSLGVILFEMCALKPPFDANNLTALALRISKGEYQAIPGHYSEQLKKIIADLLVVDPAKRPSINQILKYSLLKKRIDKFLPQSIREREFSHTTLHSQNIFQRDELKKQITKLTNQQPQLIVSPRNIGNFNSFFSGQVSHSKSNANLNIRDSGIKDKNQCEKKKKNDKRKRQTSEPGLTPKNTQKKIKTNKSLTNLEKKKSDKERNNFFKKKRLPEDYQNQLQEIRQFRDCVVEMHQHLSSDRQKEQHPKQILPLMTNNFIKEEDEFQSQDNSYSGSEEADSEKFTKQTTLIKKNNQFSVTLEKILIEMMGEKKLSRGYYEIQQNQGFILGSKEKNSKADENQHQFSNEGLSNEGLVSLLYGINNFLTA